MRIRLRALLFFVLAMLLMACGTSSVTDARTEGTSGSNAGAVLTGSKSGGRTDASGAGLDEHGSYTSKEDVALFLHTYGHLPDNYITKQEAQDLGWGGGVTLDKAAPGMSIGGSRFGNYEGLLPEKKGRKYYECDIDYVRGGRNAKRIVYSNDGLIFYTDDHYNSFEQLY